MTNTQDSEECVNDTWYAAWNYIPPKKPTKLSVFLGKITRGLAIDILRKKYALKRTDMHIVYLVDEIESLNQTVVHCCLDEHLEAVELIALINRFLENLSEKDRDIFIRRYWFLDPIKDIAGRHYMTEGAIKQNIMRNKRKLQKFLEREGGIEI